MTDPITKEYVDTKSALIRAGLKELRENGYNNFSIRRVAADCGISCAAPYRHFKNKGEFVLECFKNPLGFFGIQMFFNSTGL